jgi:hypothetical protein
VEFFLIESFYENYHFGSGVAWLGELVLIESFYVRLSLGSCSRKLKGQFCRLLRKYVSERTVGKRGGKEKVNGSNGYIAWIKMVIVAFVWNFPN